MSLFRKLRNTFRGNALSSELDNELAFHVAERADELIAQGLPKDEAFLQARKAFGNSSLVKERTRDMNIAGWLDAVREDFAYAWRQLGLNPGFTAIAVLSLGLGIGANTAIFQLIDGIRLRGLPVERPSELAALNRPRDFFVSGAYTSRNVAFTSAQLASLSKHQRAFSELLFFNDTRFNMSPGGRPHYVDGLFVSPSFLHVLGLRPILGRDFASDEAQSCADSGVLISHSFWTAVFGGDMNVVGKLLTLEGQKVPIIGVTPAGFYGVEPGLKFDIAAPLCADRMFATDGKGRLEDPMAWWLAVIGRLRPGWTVAQASKHLLEISPAVFRESLPAEYRPDAAKRYRANKLDAVSASSGMSLVRRQYESPLWILMCISGVVLLIACANLANLLLARGSAREREIAVRQALGASRSRLVLQMLSESVLLSFLGAVAGLALAKGLTRSLLTFLGGSDAIQFHLPLDLDRRIFLFTGSLACLTCLLFGLVPALRASAASPISSMRGSRTSTSTRERHGLRRILVISQVALSLVLLVAAILFTRSLAHLFASSVGFDARNVLVATISARTAGSVNPDDRAGLFRAIDARFAKVPGISSYSAVRFVPLGGFGWNGNVHADNDKLLSAGQLSWFDRSGPGYFATMGTSLLTGRDFTPHDDVHAPEVAVVNQSFAKRFFGGKNPVGRSFRIEEGAGKADRIYQVVGLVADTKYSELREDPQPIAFFPVAQDKEVGTERTFVFRVNTVADGVARSLQREVAAVNPNLLVEFKLLHVQIQDSILRERLMANLTAGFGFLAALLSTLGLYGVMSYLVARRRSEIGIRLAIGADRADVFGLVVRDALFMVAVGIVAGLCASLLLSKYAESLLFQLKGNDPLTLVMGCLLLLGTALAASMLPAYKAASVQPTIALREE